MNHITAPTSEHVEKALRESKLDAGTIDLSHRSFKRHLDHKEKGMSPAGWHGADDIATLKGLAGDYHWSEDPLRPLQMHFKFDHDHEGSKGTYRLTTPAGAPQEGIFYCVPNNPAIGWAFVSLVPNGGGAPTPFTVAGMLTDASWKIWVLMLNKIGPDGPIDPPFTVVRFL